MAPRVTLGVPVFNGAEFLDETLTSLRRQTCDELEILIADNASTDATPDIIAEHASDDARIRVLTSETNRGAAWNYNRLVDETTTEFFKWAAADDLCEPRFVETCVAALDDAGPDTVIAWPQTLLIDRQGAEIRPIDDSELILDDATPAARVGRLLRGRFEWHPVFGVIRTAPLRTTNLIPGVVLGDIILLAQLAALGRFVQVPERLFLRRYHDDRSVIRAATPDAQAEWFATGTDGRVVTPQITAIRTMHADCLRLGLPLATRLRCAAALHRNWTLPHARAIGGEVKWLVRAAQRR